MPTLTAADREFFAALGDVVFLNPFSERRAQLIVKLAPGAKLADREALARVVAPRLAPLIRELERLSAEDRLLLEPALLYVSYHRCVPQLDALIERQAKGGASLPRSEEHTSELQSLAYL